MQTLPQRMLENIFSEAETIHATENGEHLGQVKIIT